MVQRPKVAGPTDEVVAKMKATKAGWSGPGSKGPSKKAIKISTSILLGVEGARFPYPLVAPTKPGGIFMLWACYDRRIELLINHQGEASFSTILSQRDEEGQIISDTTSEGFIYGSKSFDQMMAWYLSANAAHA